MLVVGLWKNLFLLIRGIVLFRRFILKCIKFYMVQVSPFFSLRCRHIPTCSRYMLEAVEYYGVFKGVFKGLKRLLRCNIFFKGGFDPVIKNEIENEKNKEV